LWFEPSHGKIIGGCVDESKAAINLEVAK